LGTLVAERLGANPCASAKDGPAGIRGLLEGRESSALVSGTLLIGKSMRRETWEDQANSQRIGGAVLHVTLVTVIAFVGY